MKKLGVIIEGVIIEGENIEGVISLGVMAGENTTVGAAAGDAPSTAREKNAIRVTKTHANGRFLGTVLILLDYKVYPMMRLKATWQS